MVNGAQMMNKPQLCRNKLQAGHTTVFYNIHLMYRTHTLIYAGAITEPIKGHHSADSNYPRSRVRSK